MALQVSARGGGGFYEVPPREDLAKVVGELGGVLNPANPNTATDILIQGDIQRCFSLKNPDTFKGSGIQKAVDEQLSLSAAGTRAKPLAFYTLGQLIAAFPVAGPRCNNWGRFSCWKKPHKHWKSPPKRNESCLKEYTRCWLASGGEKVIVHGMDKDELGGWVP